MSDTGRFTIAAAQVSPVFLQRDATVAKACEVIGRAAEYGARLVVLPEAYIPTYPDWIWSIPPGEGGLLADLYGALLDNAVEIPGPATDRLCEAAAEAGIYVVMGMNERNVEASGTTLYNTLLYLEPEGRILGKHRKMVPTGAERLVWAQGDGSTLGVHDTSIGKLGGLICWENYMPLARYALYAWGTQIYVAATWDRGDTWLATLQHTAKEGGVYAVGCCMALRTSDIPDGLRERFYPPPASGSTSGGARSWNRAAGSLRARWSERRTSCTPRSIWAARAGRAGCWMWPGTTPGRTSSS